MYVQAGQRAVEVVPEEAEIIRLAADLYLEGYGRYKLEDAFATVNIKGRLAPTWEGTPSLT